MGNRCENFEMSRDYSGGSLRLHPFVRDETKC